MYKKLQTRLKMVFNLKTMQVVLEKKTLLHQDDLHATQPYFTLSTIIHIIYVAHVNVRPLMSNTAYTKSKNFLLKLGKCNAFFDFCSLHFLGAISPLVKVAKYYCHWPSILGVIGS